MTVHVCCFPFNGAQKYFIMDFPLLLYYWNFTSLTELACLEHLFHLINGNYS